MSILTMGAIARDVEITPLPPGRKDMTRAEVRANQRARLISAAIQSYGTAGYQGTSVADILKLARVSRTVFYDIFDDRLACFLTACKHIADEIIEELYEAGLKERNWATGLEAGVTVYLEFWQRYPDKAVTIFLELPSAGPPGLAFRDELFEQFELLFTRVGKRARRENPDLPVLHPLAPRAIVAFSAEFVAREIRAGRAGHLSKSARELLELQISLLTR